MFGSPQHLSRKTLLAAAVFALLLVSNGAFAVVTKTVTNTATVDLANSGFVNVVGWRVSNDPTKEIHFTQFESHLQNQRTSVSSTVLIPVTEVPTLSPAGAIALVLFLAGFAWYLSRRRSASP